MTYQPKKIDDSVWFKKDRAIDSAVALKAAVEMWTADKIGEYVTVEELADALYLWLRNKREQGHPKEEEQKTNQVPFN